MGLVIRFIVHAHDQRQGSVLYHLVSVMRYHR